MSDAAEPATKLKSHWVDSRELGLLPDTVRINLYLQNTSNVEVFGTGLLLLVVKSSV